MKVRRKRKRGRPGRRWLDKVRDDIKENGLSGEEMYHRATWRRICHRTSTPHKSVNKMNRKNTKNKLMLTIDSHKLPSPLEQCQHDWHDLSRPHGVLAPSTYHSISAL